MGETDEGKHEGGGDDARDHGLSKKLIFFNGKNSHDVWAEK